MTDDPEKRKLIRDQADVLADTLDGDILLFNFEIWPNADWRFIQTVAQRRPRRRQVYLILVTEGGLADSAFRMMRALQSSYERVTVVVPGWCKSAGTLMCIGAHEIQMGVMGELGPLDVQIVKADEMDEQKSGVVVGGAFDSLRQEAYKYFMGFVRDLAASEYRLTLKTAFDIATRMTSGAMQPIFDKLEPVTIGEDYRSNRLALAYAERLDHIAKNLKRSQEYDALETLLAGYPSHGFAIDSIEAADLFKNVKPISDELAELMIARGVDCFFPRNRRQEQEPQVEYLNNAPDQSKSDTPAARPSDPSGAGVTRKPSRVRRNPEKRGRAPAGKPNGAAQGNTA